MQDSYLHFIIYDLKGMILDLQSHQCKEQGHKVYQKSEFRKKRLYNNWMKFLSSKLLIILSNF